MDAFEVATATVVGAWDVALDLHGCNNAKIRDAEHVQGFVRALSRTIGMKPSGKCTVIDFGAEPRVSGFSLLQRGVGGASITGHFSNESDRVFLNVSFPTARDPFEVAQCAEEWFNMSDYTVHTTPHTAVGTRLVPARTTWDLDSWGWEAVVTLKGCNKTRLSDRQFIKQFVRDLCVVIDMKRFGPCTVAGFTTTSGLKGLSALQLIETSNVLIRTVPETGELWMLVFSCKTYDPQTTADFTRRRFGGESHVLHAISRK